MSDIEYKANRMPTAFSIRPTWTQQGHISPMNYSAEPIVANIYQVVLVTKEREDYHNHNTDNVNIFTFVATQEEGILKDLDLWYNRWSESGIPFEMYDVQINMVMRNVIVHQLGLIQFSYCW